MSAAAAAVTTPATSSLHSALPSWISNPTPSHLFFCLFVLAILYAAYTVIYNLYFSPLSAIPGPWYAAVSDFWLTTHVLRLEQCKTIHRLFEIYGPVVRVGPNKVVFNDLSTQETVYRRFEKSSYYKSLLT
jgi:hypothetical protein